MIEKFNGIFYLAVFIIHFIGFAYYGFRCVFQTKSFLDQYGIDDTGAGMVRFFGSIFFANIGHEPAYAELTNKTKHSVNIIFFIFFSLFINMCLTLHR